MDKDFIDIYEKSPTGLIFILLIFIISLLLFISCYFNIIIMKLDILAPAISYVVPP